MTEAAALAQAEEGTSLPEGGDVETKAKRLGWVPKEEFKGDPTKHRSAEEFLKRGEEIVPLLKRDNEKLHQKFSEVEAELKETRETLKTFSEFTTRAAEREYKRSLRELEIKLDTAIASADVDSARALRKEIAELQDDIKQPDPIKKGDDPKIDPAIQAWIAENEWFNKSPSLRAFAAEEFGELEKEFPGKPKVELLAEVKQRTMDQFPKKFGINPRREGAAAVATPGGVAGGPKKGGRTYDDLPADARAACDKFVKTIPGYTKDKYLKDYEWE